MLLDSLYLRRTPHRSTLTLVALGFLVVACGDSEGGAGTGGSGSGQGGDTNGTAGEAPTYLCDDPVLLEQNDGAPSGLAECPGGVIHRYEAVACDTEVSVPACEGTETNLSCTTDADCTAKPNGKCGSGASLGMDATTFCSCVYPCATDADCETGEVCLCRGPAYDQPSSASQCVPANCTTNDDCDSGECGLSSWENDACGTQRSVVCRTDADECRSFDDCEDGIECGAYSGDEVYSCVYQSCEIG